MLENMLFGLLSKFGITQETIKAYADYAIKFLSETDARLTRIEAALRRLEGAKNDKQDI